MKTNRLRYLGIFTGVLVGLAVYLLFFAGLRVRPAVAALPPPAASAPAIPQAIAKSGRGGDFLVTLADDVQGTPDIAYNPDDDEYLIVWADHRDVVANRYDIYSQIYSAQGLPQGENIPISIANENQTSPVVSYNPAAGEYLVVWGDSRNGLDYNIYGQRVSAAGVLLDNLSTPQSETDPSVNFPITQVSDSQQIPAIAYNSLTDEYLVVWEDFREGNNNMDIYGQRVDADGYLLGDPDTTVENFRIATETSGQHDPAVEYNAAGDEYLVVWEDSRGSVVGDIYGQRVDADGSLLGNSDPTVNFAIAVAVGELGNPDIAYNQDDHQYLVVWQRFSGTSDDIEGQRVATNGSLLGDLISINAQIEDQGNPKVAYNAEQKEYLVVWQDARNADSTEADIYGHRMKRDGSLNPMGDFAIANGVGGDCLPALAYSTTTHQYLVVWDMWWSNNGEEDIYGQRVGWSEPLLGHAFIVSAPTGSQTHPAVAFNTREYEYLVVWADERGGDVDIFGQRYDRNGVPLGENFAITDAPGDQNYPDVTYNSIDNRYLVVWEEGNGEAIMGQELSAQGDPIDVALTFLTENTPSGLYHLSRPVVAHTSNPALNRYLVVYRGVEDVDGSNDIFGHYWSRTEGLLWMSLVRGIEGQTLANPELVYNLTNDEFLIVFETDGDIIGLIEGIGSQRFPFNISTAPDTQSDPAVAWNPEDNQYLVVWHDYRNSGTQGADTYAQRLAVDGSLLGTNFMVSSAVGVNYQQYPDVAYIDHLGQYRIVWQDDREGANGYDLRGQWVSAGGSVLGAFDDPIFRYTGWQERPAMAYDPTYENALVVWQDGRNGVEYDIYGKFGALDMTPPVARFTRDPNWGRVGDTFTFNAWPSRDAETPRGWLRARWDFNSDGTWETAYSLDKYITRTVMTPGIYTVTLEVMDTSFLTSQVAHRIVVFPAVSWLSPAAEPPVASLIVTPTYATAGQSFSFDGSASAGTGTLYVRWDWENDGEFDTGFSTVLTATHVYTESGDTTVRFELRDNATGLSKASIRNLLVLPGPITGLEIAPQGVELAVGDIVDFRIMAWDSYGNEMYSPSVTWSVTDPLAGTIDASGVFTASLNAGTYTDVILAQSGAVTDHATVTIYWPFDILLPLILR